MKELTNEPINIEIEIKGGKPTVSYVSNNGKTSEIAIISGMPTETKRPVGKIPSINIVLNNNDVLVNPGPPVHVTVYDYDVLSLDCADIIVRQTDDNSAPERCLVTKAIGQVCYI